MLQDFIDRHFYSLLIFTLFFGVIFYDTLGFKYTDEICTLMFCVLYIYYIFHTKDWEINKLFLITIGIFMFYLIYSITINSNIKIAIFTDFIIQIKPYLCFFCIYAIAPKLDNKKKQITRYICIIISIYLFILGIIDLFMPYFLYSFMDHPSRFATAVSITALLYLYSSEYTLKDKIIFITMLSIGLISGRSKFYGFYALSLFLVFYINKNFKLKFNLKNLIFFLIAISAILLVAKEKIVLYFIEGGLSAGKGEEDFYARMALYYFSGEVFTDFFPFGSGFASFATYASAEYYSPLYAHYHIDIMHGLTPKDPSFMADTYYPALAQFGIIGALLFFAFWIYLSKKAFAYFDILKCTKEFVTSILIIGFFLIECTSDSTITHNRGLFMMMLLGLILSNMKTIKDAS